MRTPSILAALASVATLQQVQAYFILQGRPIVIERIDPIVSPGKVASHVHNIVGVSSAFVATRLSDRGARSLTIQAIISYTVPVHRRTISMQAQTMTVFARVPALHSPSQRISLHTGSHSCTTTTQLIRPTRLYHHTPRSTTFSEMVPKVVT